MFSADLGVTPTAAGPSDPNFKNVSLLLNGNGTNGAQNNTFLDSSSNNFTITRNGNTTQGTFSPFSVAEGQWSNYFDGSGDWLTTSSIAGFGTNNWTTEFWINSNSISTYQVIYDYRTSSQGLYPQVGIDTAGKPYFYINSTIVLTSSIAITLNAWTHIAFVKNSNVLTVYINGVSGGTYSDSNNYLGNMVTIGASGLTLDSHNYVIKGYLSNLRIVNGTAVYTANFTPPTSPLTAISGTSLLTCQSNRFKDNSSNNFTITRNGDTKVTAFSPFAPSAAYDASTNGGSGYFDGTGDYLSVIGNAGFSTTGDFTLEAWAYVSGASTYQGIVSLMSATAPNNGASINILNNGYFRFGLGASTNQSVFVPLNQWFHVALVRSGSSTNNCSCYLNGTRVGQFTSTEQVSGASNSLTVGKYYADGSVQYLINGYISNARYVVGSALYSGTTYTVPTAPLAAVSGTQLLLNFTNAGIIDNAGKNDIETVGNARIVTTVKKYNTGSMYFDGTGDYLVAPANNGFDFGSGDYTVELWANISAHASTGGVVSKGPTGSVANAQWSIEFYGTSNNLSVFINAANSGAYIINGSTGIVGNGWNHIALCRSGSSTKLFINGVQDGSTYNGSYTIADGQPFYCGGQAYAPTTRTITGYIDDLRITKGLARYTANFTPPTQAFPDQ